VSIGRAHDRRKHPRVPAHTLAFLSAHLSGGAAVTLVDVSHRGVRLETTRHMRPGQTVCIRLAIDDTTVSVNAAVVRAAVTHLEAETVQYETALALSDDCEQLRVALVERRRATLADRAEPVEPPPAPAALALVAEETLVDRGRGWWLAMPARRHGGGATGR
jgi:hypothetical protein